ncbi:MAG: ABC transporter permease [Oscillospiraceae bacterium]|nr:ABC transporter permease [Oscillospiraceae bacterium]MBO7373614.1 ABC transporter permease [Oscillospiraceae bacterium]
MTKTILKRIGMLAVTMLLVSFLTFLAFELVSGDPVRTMLGVEATEAQVTALRQQLGLDLPFALRYFRWLGGFFSGDLGLSYSYKLPVWDLIGGKLELTLWLSLLSFALITVISIPLGVFSYRLEGGFWDWPRTLLNQLCMAVPPFFTGILISWCFGILLRMFTPGEFPGLDYDFFASLRHLFFGALCLSIPRIAMTVRMLRATVISEMNKAYVRTAISRGNDRRSVLTRHVLKNSMVSTVTFLGQTLAELVGAGIVVEQVLGIPGLGRFLVTSILHRDYPVVQAIVVILAFWVCLAGMLADLVNQTIDPRLRA